MRYLTLVVGGFLLLLGGVFLATDTAAQKTSKAPTRTAVEQPDTQHLGKLGLTVQQVTATDVADLFEITTNQGVFYLSADGTRLISGGLFDISGEAVRDLTTPSVEQMRKTQIAQMADTSILYAAEDEKHRITVFTDISCSYCQQLHQRMDDYLAAGISIQYMAFPRNGLSGDIFNQMESIWCAKDPKQRMDAAKAGRKVASATCDSPVREHYALAKQFGITGTPAAVTADGVLLSGFRPPALMLKDLAETAAQQAAAQGNQD